MAYGLEKIVSEDAPIYQQMVNYYKFCERRRLSEQTMIFKEASLNHFLKVSGLQDLNDITNKHIDDWLDFMIGNNNAGRTINNRLIQLRVLLRWQRDDNQPLPNIKIGRIVLQRELPPRKVFFTREQINKALSFADRREWLMIKLGFDCGLRISELRNLRLYNINGRRMRIVGKGSKLRYVKMSEEARTRLDDWIEREKVVDYLWASPRHPGQPICDHDARIAIERPFKAAGFNDFRPHDLRHSYATELKMLGVPTRLIQAGLGHSSEAITEKYLSDLDGFNIDEIYDVKFAAPDPGLR